MYFHAWHHARFRVENANICHGNHNLHMTRLVTTRGITRVHTRRVILQESRETHVAV